jgi:hypothetical protein
VKLAADNVDRVLAKMKASQLAAGHAIYHTALAAIHCPIRPDYQGLDPIMPSEADVNVHKAGLIAKKAQDLIVRQSISQFESRLLPKLL